jgi:spore maturation protein CgeB
LKILIVNTDYPEFLAWLYAKNPGLEAKPFRDQAQARAESLFGVADFYSSNLRKLGHEAYDVWANNPHMQTAWASEVGIEVSEQAPITRGTRAALQKALRTARRTPLRYLRFLFGSAVRSIESPPAWFSEILAEQVKYYAPDVVLNQSMWNIRSNFLKDMKPFFRLLVGQIASPIPKDEDFSCYDLVISSLPNLVEHFKQIGVPAELHRLGFEPTILDRLKDEGKTVPVSFVGSLSPAHKSRIQLLDYLCARLDMKIWGPTVNGLPKQSPIRHSYQGNAWGVEMYQILHRSKITLNHHIDVAESYANNLRLYEATGVGALLVTDWKQNLREIFEPGKEAVAYRSPEDCLESIKFHLEHDDERETIACAGQQRTLREYSYAQRMRGLVEIFDKYL